MANKIKCTCGHSWSTADSSAKDKYVCHICGKNNMKEGGWLRKYDVPEAQNGIEGTMGGLTDKGFNYNGAWGGPSMAMGGSLPGSVGFTYARTGSIPSNGPYAKKTKASAQNGKEMSFYQNGLDWTPRNISRDGSMIPQAQLGTHMLPIDPSKAAENFFELMSVPQKALTALFSGKYETPSEAMNIKSPVGAFAIDAVLDPVNLIGTSLSKKAIRFKPNPEMMYRGLSEEGFKDAIKSGSFRQAGIESGVPKHKDVWYASGNKGFSRAKDFSKDFTAEVPESAFPNASLDKFRGSPGMETRGTSRHIPITEGRILKKDWLKGYKEVPKKKEGGVIKDDRGQWAHPGEITEIQGNTMVTHGYGEIPLWVEPNVGEPRLIQPNTGTHKFPGANKFKETPVSKNWLEKYK